MSVGNGESIQRVVFHWDREAEGKWPNIFYVGCSRAKTENCLLLRKPIIQHALRSIGTSDSYRRKKAEIDRITNETYILREQLQQQGIGTKKGFYDQLTRLCRVSTDKISCSRF